MSRLRGILALSIVSMCVCVTDAVQAAGINTNVALPVREGGYVYRTQLRFLSASDDPTLLDRDVDIYAIPNVLVYGVTARTTLFGVLPYFSRSVDFTDTGSLLAMRSWATLGPSFDFRSITTLFLPRLAIRKSALSPFLKGPTWR